MTNESSVTYQIENLDNPAPFVVQVVYNPSLTLYSIKVGIHDHWYTRDVGADRLNAIILAKDTARSLEDAFRLMYLDKS